MPTKKYVDDTCFNTTTNDSCYWAGFLAADGSVDINNTISFELKDKDAVVAFKEFTKSEHEIGEATTKSSYRIRFISSSICKDLLYNFNISVNKTHNMHIPLFADLNNYAAYYRGFFDGDGCFTEFFTNRPTSTYRVYLTNGSLDFLEETLVFLKEKSIIKGGSIAKKANNCWHIQLAVKDSESFLTWIYSVPGYRLARKYDKYYNAIVLGIRYSK